jgi:hypothetical protein
VPEKANCLPSPLPGDTRVRGDRRGSQAKGRAGQVLGVAPRAGGDHMRTTRTGEWSRINARDWVTSTWVGTTW